MVGTRGGRKGERAPDTVARDRENVASGNMIAGTRSVAEGGQWKAGWIPKVLPKHPKAEDLVLRGLQ